MPQLLSTPHLPAAPDKLSRPRKMLLMLANSNTRMAAHPRQVQKSAVTRWEETAAPGDKGLSAVNGVITCSAKRTKQEREADGHCSQQSEDLRNHGGHVLKLVKKCRQTTHWSFLQSGFRFVMTVSLVSHIVTPILLLVGTFCFGILSIGLRRTLLSCNCSTPTCKPSCRAKRGKLITSFLIYLGGGVLLATCLIHLLPEAREGFETHEANVEAQRNLLDNESSENFFGDSVLFSNGKPALNGTERPRLNLTDDDSHGHEHGEQFPMPEFVVCMGFFAVYAIEEILHFFLGGHQHIPTETRAKRSLSRSNSCNSPCVHETGTTGENMHVSTFEGKNAMASTEELCHPSPNTKPDLGFSVSSLLTVAALSFHSLFEGFAIGLQDTDKGVWILFAAISVHKFVIAFVVGLEALASGSRELLVVIYMSVFAAMSPLGMVAAIITQTNVEDSSPLTVGVLNALATGTLLYVTFFEILQKDEEHNNLKGWQQFVATILGFGIMCIVQYGSTLA